MLSVSGVTIRNDLNYLEQQGYLKRSFGGAIYTAQPVRAAVSHEVVQSQALEHSVELELAKQVARLVCDDDTVFLGAGEVLRKALPFRAIIGICALSSTILAMLHRPRDYIDGEIVLLGGVLGHSGQALGRNRHPIFATISTVMLSGDGGPYQRGWHAQREKRKCSCFC